MRFFEIALLGGAAYLILKGGSVAGVNDAGFNSISPTTPLSLPGLAPGTTAGGILPGTTIPMSSGFAAKLAEIPAAQIATAKTTDLGKITVKAAPLATNPPAVISEVKQIFQKEYLSGKFVPSSVLAGKPTKWDIQIAQNIAKKSFKI